MESWFKTNQRALPWRKTYDPYLVWVSEVMLQQTRMEVVLRYYDRFVSIFPSIKALSRASEEKVLAAWSGLGYYRRARMLRAGAVAIAESEGRLPQTVEALMTIPGIGRYTAGAIASIAYDQHSPIVDGNIARILARLFAIEAPLGSSQLMREAWRHSEALVAASKSPRLFNQGLMEIGALVCTPKNPSCARCPLTAHCAAFISSRTAELPAKKVAGPTRALSIPLYYISDERGRVLMRREAGDLMTSMFHLPHGDTALFAAPPLRVSEKTLIGSFRHTVTNRRIEFRLVAADLNGSIAESVDEYAWIDPKELARIPHPSYVAKAVAMATVKSPACAGG